MIESYETDDELAARLGRLLAHVDPVPATVLAAAKASATWRSIDAELASLMYDSVLDSDELVGVRGGGNRLLTFSSPDATIEVEVLGGGRSLVGQVTGVAPVRLEICSREGARATESDALGHFSCEGVPPGPVSVRATGANGTVIQTEWVVI